RHMQPVALTDYAGIADIRLPAAQRVPLQGHLHCLEQRTAQHAQQHHRECSHRSPVDWMYGWLRAAQRPQLRQNGPRRGGPWISTQTASAWSWTPATARPDGSAMLAKLASQAIAVGEEQAIDLPPGTVSAAARLGKNCSNRWR